MTLKYVDGIKTCNTSDDLLPTPPGSPKISLPSIPRSSAASSITKSAKDESVYSLSSSPDTLIPDGLGSGSLREMFPSPPHSVLLSSLPSVPRSSLTSNFGLDWAGDSREFYSQRQEIGAPKKPPKPFNLQPEPESSTLDILDSTKITDISPATPKFILGLQDQKIFSTNSELPIINRLQEEAQAQALDSASIISLPSPPRSPNISLPSVPRSSSTSSISTYPSRKSSHQNSKRTFPKGGMGDDDDKFHQQIGDQRFNLINQSRRRVWENIPERPSNILQPSPHPPPSIPIDSSFNPSINQRRRIVPGYIRDRPTDILQPLPPPRPERNLPSISIDSSFNSLIKQRRRIVPGYIPDHPSDTLQPSPPPRPERSLPSVPIDSSFNSFIDERRRIVRGYIPERPSDILQPFPPRPERSLPSIPKPSDTGSIIRASESSQLNLMPPPEEEPQIITGCTSNETEDRCCCFKCSWCCIQ